MFIEEGGGVGARGDFFLSPFPIPLLLAQKGPTRRRFGFGPPDPAPARTGKKNDFYAEQFILLYPHEVKVVRCGIGGLLIHFNYLPFPSPFFF